MSKQGAEWIDLVRFARQMIAQNQSHGDLDCIVWADDRMSYLENIVRTALETGYFDHSKADSILNPTGYMRIEPAPFNHNPEIMGD